MSGNNWNSGGVEEDFGVPWEPSNTTPFEQTSSNTVSSAPVSSGSYSNNATGWNNQNPNNPYVQQNNNNAGMPAYQQQYQPVNYQQTNGYQPGTGAPYNGYPNNQYPNGTYNGMPPQSPNDGGSMMTAALIMSIVSYLFLGLLLSIPSLIMSIVAKGKWKAAYGESIPVPGKGKAAMIVSIISIVLNAVMVIVLVASLGGAMSSLTSVIENTDDNTNLSSYAQNFNYSFNYSYSDGNLGYEFSSGNTSESLEGTKMTFDGIDIVFGQTTLSTLEQSGWTLDEYSINSYSNLSAGATAYCFLEVPEKYTNNGYDIAYVDIILYNPSTNTISIDDAAIYGMSTQLSTETSSSPLKVSLNSKIALGSSRADIEQAYGAPTSTFGESSTGYTSINYTDDEYNQLTFTIENDIVTGIDYSKSTW